MNTLKETVLRTAISRKRAVVDDFNQRIKDATATDGNVNEEEYDNQKKAFEAQILSEVNLLTEQLQIAERDLADLQRIDVNAGESDVVGFGNIVKTDQRTFFVSTGIEDFVVNGQTITGISVHSPIYHAMQGKRPGEKFTQSGISYTIREIL